MEIVLMYFTWTGIILYTIALIAIPLGVVCGMLERWIPEKVPTFLLEVSEKLGIPGLVILIISIVWMARTYGIE